MNDEEFLANLQNIDNEKLIQSLQSCGHDGYYNDLYYPIIEEIKRRLSFFRSADPERKKGKWIVKEEDWRKQQSWNECSECSFPTSYQYNFCPNCGAEMKEES